MNALKIFFNYFETHNFAAIIAWVFLGYFLAKIYDIFFHKKILSLPFLKLNEDKLTWLALLFVGIVLLILTIIVEFFYHSNLIWYLISISAIVGGILGLLPFSFSKKK